MFSCVVSPLIQASIYQLNWPRNGTGVSYIADGFSTKWATKQQQQQGAYQCAPDQIGLLSLSEETPHILCLFLAFSAHQGKTMQDTVVVGGCHL